MPYEYTIKPEEFITQEELDEVLGLFSGVIISGADTKEGLRSYENDFFHIVTPNPEYESINQTLGFINSRLSMIKEFGILEIYTGEESETRNTTKFFLDPFRPTEVELALWELDKGSPYPLAPYLKSLQE